MKNLILTFGLGCMTALCTTAQTKNVDLDRVYCTYKYRALPTQPQDPIYFRYTTRVTSSKVAETKVSIPDLQNALRIEGQTYTPDEAEAKMLLEAYIGNIIIKGSNIAVRTVEDKDRDGKVTKVTRYYSVDVSYTFESSYRISAEGKELAKGYLYSHNGNALVFKTAEFSTSQAAADNWNNNREVFVAEFYRDLANKTIGDLSYRATSLYGFMSRSLNFILWTSDEKKHNENIPFQEAIGKLKTILQAMDANTPVDREAAQEVIEYFKGIPARYADVKLKADVKLRYAAYFSLCTYYLYADEPEKVAEYADLLIANEYDKKDGEKMKKEASALIEIFLKVGMRSRHFVPQGML
ncbi:MAG: hypothetical protein LBH06_05450 [Rikenellaceae bacterium]|jgi:hypothetical protein|nr:hypothetical protein [Rikenellaceae bacterium]